MRADLDRFLADIPLFRDLDRTELGEILGLARPFSFPSGHHLCQQGEPSDGMYVIERGRARISARLLGDEQVELSIVGPGEVIGELALVDGGTRSASVDTLEPASGYFFSRRRFELLRADFRPSAFKVMRQLSLMLCARVRAVHREIAGLPPVPRATGSFIGPPRWLPPRVEARRSSTATLDRAQLGFLPFFGALAHDELEALLRPMRRVDATRGYVLFGEGSPATSCFVVVRGAVQSDVRQADVSQAVALLGPGRLVGPLELVDGGPRSTSCFARETAVLAELDAKEFERLVRDGSSAGVRLFDAVNMALVDAVRGASRQLARLSAEVRDARITGRPTSPARID
jgi:CRP-like cAMP-binding protein